MSSNYFYIRHCHHRRVADFRFPVNTSELKTTKRYEIGTQIVAIESFSFHKQKKSNLRITFYKNQIKLDQQNFAAHIQNIFLDR